MVFVYFVFERIEDDYYVREGGVEREEDAKAENQQEEDVALQNGPNCASLAYFTFCSENGVVAPGDEEHADDESDQAKADNAINVKRSLAEEVDLSSSKEVLKGQDGKIDKSVSFVEVVDDSDVAIK